MARKNLYRSSVHPYHVTARSNNGEWFYIPTLEAWNIFVECAFAISVAYGAKIHAFVLMSNHFHLLVSTPDSNLDDVMQYFLREAGKLINLKAKRINHIFGGRY